MTLIKVTTLDDLKAPRAVEPLAHHECAPLQGEPLCKTGNASHQLRIVCGDCQEAEIAALKRENVELTDNVMKALHELSQVSREKCKLMDENAALRAEQEKVAVEFILDRECEVGNEKYAKKLHGQFAAFMAQRERQSATNQQEATCTTPN